MKQPTLGIIGFGQMGQLMAQLFQPYFSISIYDTQPPAQCAFAISTLEDMAHMDYIMLAVPVQAVTDVCQQLSPYIQPHTLVFDIGSVKEVPAKAMQAALPAGQPILPLHPLFGPQSYARDGLAGAPLVWCDKAPLTPATQYLWDVFETHLRLKIHTMTPTTHDQHMAYVMGLTHLIGFTLNRMTLPTLALETASYTHLRQLRDLLSQDSQELFAAIQTLNPYAADVTTTFKQEMAQLLKS